MLWPQGLHQQGQLGGFTKEAHIQGCNLCQIIGIISSIIYIHIKCVKLVQLHSLMLKGTTSNLDFI